MRALRWSWSLKKLASQKKDAFIVSQPCQLKALISRAAVKPQKAELNSARLLHCYDTVICVDLNNLMQYSKLDKENIRMK